MHGIVFEVCPKQFEVILGETGMGKANGVGTPVCAQELKQLASVTDNVRCSFLEDDCTMSERLASMPTAGLEDLREQLEVCTTVDWAAWQRGLSTNHTLCLELC